MKQKNYLVLVFFLLLALNSFAQKNPGCGTKLSEKEEAIFRQALPKIETARKAGLGKKKASGPYIIPVVFHILTDGTNINRPFTKAEMKCRIDAAIEVCNKDFNDLYNNVYPDAQNPGFKNEVSPLFAGVRSKLDIQFVAATVDPEGNLLEYAGMDWHPDAHISYGYDPKIYDFLYFGKNGKYYLDVLVVDEPNRIGETNGSGHAFLPVQETIPRVTYNHRYIGNTCGSQADFQFAKEMSHEFGHYFGLKHTFDKGPSNADCDPINDGMADTPPTTQGFTTVLDAVNPCNVVANYQNLMDYNVGCQRMFTKDQTTAMTYWLDDVTVAKYPRGLLWQTSNLSSVGVIAAAPIANFSSNTTSVCAGKSVSFKDTSLGLPTNRTWTFEGGTPATSTEKNPTVVYSTPGKYKVKLEVSNSVGNDSKEILGYMEIGQITTADLSESFDGVFPPKGWSITNPDNGLTWEKRKDVGHTDQTCMVMNNADNATLGAMDYIRLPFFDLSAGTNSQMFFDVAYTKFDDASPDVLKIQVSTDCEATWHDVYSKTHTELQTTEIPTELSNGWIPKTDENWRKEVVDLSQYVGQSNVTIRFSNKSGYGTRIWIDNVNVVLKNSLTPVSDFTSNVRRTNCSSLTVPFVDTSIGNPTSWAWTFDGGTPATSTLQNPTVTYSSQGVYSVSLTTKNANGTGTPLTKSNFITVAIPEKNSFTESFEGVFPPAGWEIKNIDNALTWEKRSDVGRNSASCMVMNDADNKANDIDEITMQPLNLSTGITDFSFDVAYAKFDKNSPDVLEVLISKDCGVTWDKLYSKTHTILETATSTDPNNWIPTLDSQWRTERILLDSYKGQSNVLIKFKSISGFGSRIWIDNVKFTFDSKEKPFAEFTADQTSTKCTSTDIKFSDLSTGSPTSWNWEFEGGTPTTSTSKNPVITYNKPGSFKVTLTATNGYGTGAPNQKSSFITVVKPDGVSFTQDFEGTFPPAGWDINNPNDGLTWEKRADIGHNSASCMIMNEADNDEVGDIDEIMLQPVDLSKGITDFSFDLAYAKFDDVSPDVLEVLMSKDCGATWESVYEKTHTVLATAVAINDPLTDINEINLWTPTTDSDWRTERVLLTKYKGEPNVLIKLRATSGYGSRIWIDNVKFNFDSKEKPVSDFVVKGKNSCSGLPIEFSDISTGEPTSWSWSFPGGTPSTSTSQNPSVIYEKPGSYGVSLVVTGAFGVGNKAIKKDLIVIKPTNALPFTENFAGAFPIEGWESINVDGDAIVWEKRDDAGKGDLNCLVINDADAEKDKVDVLIMKSMDFTGTQTPYLHFDLAYTQYKNWRYPNDVSPDNIDILVSSDCGSTWKKVYSKDYLGLQTVFPPIEDDPATDNNDTNDWIPTQDSDWRNELIDLSIVKNQPNVLIKIVNTSGYGTRIWFDNFNINDSPEANPIGATISQTPVTCNGGVDGNDGTATVIATGGTGTLTYLWSPSGGTAATATGLTKGEYTCTITDTSLRTLVKTIKVGAAVDTSLTVTSGILTVNQIGATYQWFKCPDVKIQDAVNQSFEPVENGEYRVEVTFNQCTATSSCIPFTSLRVSDFEAKKEFVVYPNPSSGIVNFKSDFDGEFRVLNQLGQTIKTFKVRSDSDNAVNLEQFNEGVYFIHGMRGNKVVTRKLIIKK